VLSPDDDNPDIRTFAWQWTEHKCPAALCTKLGHDVIAEVPIMLICQDHSSHSIVVLPVLSARLCRFCYLDKDSAILLSLDSNRPKVGCLSAQRTDWHGNKALLLRCIAQV